MSTVRREFGVTPAPAKLRSEAELLPRSAAHVPRRDAPARPSRTAQPVIASERSSRTTVTPFPGKGEGGKVSPQRCAWCGDDPLYCNYHDTEWGVPVHDDRLLFEFLILEGAQAGLSWLTILRKREHYRRAFDGFDAEKVARYGQRQVARLLGDAGIVRNRLKIEAAINNARRFLEVQAAFGSFDAYLWRFVGGRPIQNRRKTLRQIPATTKESDALSDDLRARGFKFAGSTICYAHMQATGMVNDHLVDCFRHGEIARKIEP